MPVPNSAMLHRLFCVLFPLALVSICRADDAWPQDLRYDARNPIILDNDWNDDVYTDEYLLALASAQQIDLRGIIASVNTPDYNPYYRSISPPPTVLSSRQAVVDHARHDGFRHLPDPIMGVVGQFESRKPDDWKTAPDAAIDETKPFGSPGTTMIVETARAASKERPIVVVCGGELTCPVDAYLTDPSIADKMIIAWLGGGFDNAGKYNGWADPWAAFIALRRLRMVVFPEANHHPWGPDWNPEIQYANDTVVKYHGMSFRAKRANTNIPPDRDLDAWGYVCFPPIVSTRRLKQEIPPGRLRDYVDKEPDMHTGMVYKSVHGQAADVGEVDADAPPAIAIMTGDDYILEAHRIEWAGTWTTEPSNYSPQEGEWKAGRSYTPGQRVTHLGTFYVCVREGKGRRPEESPRHWKAFPRPDYPVPDYRDSAGSSVLLVTSVNQSVATAEWWRALTNPTAWGR